MRRSVVINTPLKAGDSKMSVEIKSTGLEIAIDDVAMGERPAKAIAAAIGNDIKSISERTSDGKRKAFNKTGRLASGVTATAKGAEWQIMAPPDRLKDPRLLERLRDLVPALANPLADADVVKAVEATAADIVKVRR